MAEIRWCFCFRIDRGDKLYLDATSSGTVTLYRLTLTASGNSASGEYMAFSNRGETREGLAEGVKITEGSFKSRQFKDTGLYIS